MITEIIKQISNSKIQDQLNYSNKLVVYSTFTVSGSSVNYGGGNSIITYPNVYTASVPNDLPSSSTLVAAIEDDFLVFVNGQYMEHSSFYIQQSGSNFVIVVNNGSLGYPIGNEDEVIVRGKFES